MTTEFEIKIRRPVNPAGSSFIKYCYGAVMAEKREVIDKYKKTFSRLLTRLGYKIEEKTEGKPFTGTVVLVLDDQGKPVKMYAKDIAVWDKVKTIEEVVEVEARGEEEE